MNRLIPALAAVLATFGIVAVATPALASTEDSQSVVVSIADLNTASPAGRAELKSRVSRAAGKVCRVNDGRGVAAHRAFSTCRETAIRNAIGE